MNQYWCRNATGDILLINYKEPGKEYKYHYDGDSHIFFTKKDSFDQSGAKEITKAEWLKVRNDHLSRLKKF